MFGSDTTSQYTAVTCWSHQAKTRVVCLLVVFWLSLLGSCGNVASQSPPLAAGKPPKAAILIKSLNPMSGSQVAAPRYGLTRNDITAIQETVPGIALIIPQRSIELKARYLDRSVAATIVGTVPERASLGAINLERGRFLLEKDVANRNNVAVISQTVAAQLFSNENPLGRSIKVGDHYFLIVGVAAMPQDVESSKAESTVSAVYLPITTMRSRFGDRVIKRVTGAFQMEFYEISEACLVLKDKTDLNPVVQAIKQVLRAAHEQQDYSVEVLAP